MDPSLLSIFMKPWFAIFLLSSAPVFAEFKLEPGQGSMKVFDDGKLISEYRTDWNVPFLYPLLSPSGANVTRHYPIVTGVEGEETDHPHHRSVWMGHGSVNGADFWSTKDSKKPQIVHLRFEKEDSAQADPQQVTFTADLEWQAEGKTLLKEKRTIQVRKPNAATYLFEFTCALKAEEDIMFGDTKEGMFAFRMDRTLRLKGKLAKSHIIDSNGVIDGETWGKRANWIAYNGPDETGEPVVAAMFDHPKNFRYPTYWHVRDYGLVSANPFGMHDFEGKKDQPHLGDYSLKKGNSMTFRYSIVLHHGDMNSANLNRLWEIFSKS